MNSLHTEKPAEGRKFAKAKELSKRLGMCSRTLARWGATGKIARYKINDRVVLFDEAEVMAFVQSAKI